MQIESLSKRLDRKLYCKVTRTSVPPVEDNGIVNLWRLVKRMPMAEWTELSPAQITTKVVDPMIEVFAKALTEWEAADVDELPVIEDEVVACFCCNDGSVPVRMLICPADEDVVIVLEILAKPSE